MNRPDDKQSIPKTRRHDKASLGGETVEPRILLSTTWVWGTLGNDTMTGTAADETFDAGYGNDTIDGGGGHDTVSYGLNVVSGVSVDLTVHTQQDTGAGGKDTLIGIDGVEGTGHDDLFAFTNPVDGATYTVAGGLGTDKIDLSNFAASAVTFGDHSLTVDLGGGQSFHISYDSVEAIHFGDVDATVLTGDTAQTAFTGHHLFLEGDNAFSMNITKGSMSWSYAADTNTLSVLGLKTTNATTAIQIDDLNTDALHVDHVVVDTRIGSLDSAADIAYLDLQNQQGPAAITVHGGTGAIGTLHGLNLTTTTVVDAQVDKIDFTGNLSGNLEIAGDVGTATISQLNGNLTIHGNLGSLHVTGLQGHVTVDGTVTTIDVTGTRTGATLQAANYAGDITHDYSALRTVAAATTAPSDAGAAAIVVTTPSADAGRDLTVNEGDLVQLDATGSSDPEGDALSFTWVQTQGPTVVLDDPTAARPTFTAPEGLVNTDLEFMLVAADGTSLGYDTVVVHLHANDDAPTAVAGPGQNVNEGDVVTLSGKASTDPEGQTLTYVWKQTAGPTVQFTSNGADISFVAPEGLVNTAMTFKLTVSDGTNTSVDTVRINVRADNDAVTVDAGATQAALPNQTITLAATANDPEQQPLTYKWTQLSGPTAAIVGDDTAQPSITAPSARAGETMRFQVAVSDGVNTTIDTVDVVIANAGPEVSASTAAQLASGAVGTLSAAGTDANGDNLTYRWTQVSGPTATISGATGEQAMFVAPTVTANTELRFQVEVSDGTATTTRMVTVTVQPGSSGHAAPGGSSSSTNEAPVAAIVETEPASGSSGGSSGSSSGSGSSGSGSSGSGSSGSSGSGSSSSGTSGTGSSGAGSSGGGTLTDPFATGSTAEHESFAPAAAAASNSFANTSTEHTASETSAAAADPAAGEPEGAGPGTAVLVDGAQPVVVSTGAEVEVSASALPRTSDNAQYTWTQVAGSAVKMVDGSGRALRIEMPETFTAEELVFQVEMQVGDEIVVEEITVQVEPVATEVRHAITPHVAHRDLGTYEATAPAESHGVGKVWASLLAFGSTGRVRR